MFLNYEKLADFIEWIAEVEKWPYFDGILKSYDNEAEIWTINYVKNNEQWIKIGFIDNSYDYIEYGFRLSTINQLYKDYKDDKGVE